MSAFFDYSKKYSEHDDRGSLDNRRRMGRNRKYNNQRGRGYADSGSAGFRQRFRDDDVDMGAGSSGGPPKRYFPYKSKYAPKYAGQRYKPKNARHDNRQRGKDAYDFDPENTWYKITVPHTKSEGKEFVLKTLLSHSKTPFVPCGFHFDGNAAVFHVDNLTVARSLVDVSKRVTLQDGFKMSVFMNKSPPPSCSMDEQAIRKIKLAMDRRYDVPTHALDLKKFHTDIFLKSEGLYVSLQRPNVLNAIIRIIKEDIQEIEKLDVSENGLYSLQAFSALATPCANLSSLSLANNRIKSVKELDHIKGLNITTLILDGNSLCDDFRDQDAYIIALRNRFPKLMILDGQELPAPIGFDLGTLSIPPSVGSYLTTAEDVKCLVIQFLEEYYAIYDSDDRKDREKLLDKYHDGANFSLTVIKLPNSNNRNNKNTGITNLYLSESRNLLRITDPSYRSKLLKNGRLSVVTALSALPQTQHDPNSFMVDVSLVSLQPRFVIVSVTGVFREVAIDMLNQPLRTFHRSFLICFLNNKWVISNDMLVIGDATPEQVKAFKCPAPTPSPSPAPSSGDKSPNEKQQLVIEFIKLTGMNIDFSTKCLEENEWDFQKSYAVFQELNSVPGRIPPEAFAIDERQQMTLEFVKLTGMNIEFSAKCLLENEWDFQKAAAVFQELNNLGRIPPEAFVNKP